MCVLPEACSTLSCGEWSGGDDCTRDWQQTWRGNLVEREGGREGVSREGRVGEREKGRGGERGWDGGRKERKRRERREKRKRGTGRERREENETTIREKTRINENDDNNQSNFIHTYIPFNNHLYSANTL